MKSVLLAFFLLCGILIPRFSQAQIVTIPDPNFVAFLQLNYPSCMSGNQMDTQCPDIMYELGLNVNNKNISDLTGLEYFINLHSFQCAYNNLTALPPLPPDILVLVCNDNPLVSLPALPAPMYDLQCNNCNLTSLPTLPAGLEHLMCEQNELTSIPELPGTLTMLYCHSNQLTSLPDLPDGMTDLRCYNNNLTSLPELPQSLWTLYADNNQLTSLPELPDNLDFLSCHNNPDLTCLPVLPNGLTGVGGILTMNLTGTQITCMPNAVPELPQPLAICQSDDGVFNPNNCQSASLISGLTYYDNSGNCFFENTESMASGIKLLLKDDSGDIVGITYSTEEGYFDFFNPAPGDYTLAIETVNVPYVVNCDFPGADTAVTIVAGYHAENIRFALNCPGVADVAVISAVNNGIVFPGLQHTLAIQAGDLVSNTIPDCNFPMGGTVTVTVDGNVTYISPAPYSLTPGSVSGNTFVYSVPDFTLVDIDSAFHLLFQTDTTALGGDSICVEVVINTSSPDLNPSNQYWYFCYPVLNSYDPNIKEVYPGLVEPGYDDWLTYTIHFQNTGTAPAFNIRLKDTLSTLVQPNSFELLGYSHPVVIELNGYNALFRFNNIMLPDSASDPPGSIGYIQYRVKPLSNLPDGTTIDNTCYIYFDYNSPIITNTATTSFEEPVLPPDETGLTENEQFHLSIYPNPTSGTFSFYLPETFAAVTQVTIYTMTGEQVASYYLTNSGLTTLDLSAEKAGVYFMTLQNGEQLITSKLIKN